MARKIIGILVVITIMMASSLTVYAAPADGANTVPSGKTVKTEPAENTEKNSEKTPDKNEKNSDKNTDKNADKSIEKDAEPEFKAILNSVIDGDAINTEQQSLFTITIPKTNEVSFTTKSYSISGTTEYKDIKMYLVKYNETTQEYEAFADAEGDSSWDIEKSKFSKEIIFKEGQNKIKIVAYRTSQEKSLKLEDVQANCFTISYLPVKFKSDPKDLAKSVEKKMETIFPKK